MMIITNTSKYEGEEMTVELVPVTTSVTLMTTVPVGLLHLTLRPMKSALV